MQDNIFDLDAYLKTLIPDLEKLLLILALGLVIFILMFFIRKFLRIFRSRFPTGIDALIILLNFSAILIWVIYIVSELKIDTSVLLGGSVFTTLIIGLSASFIGANLMGGIFIVITRPFGVGDIITYGGSRGLVTEIGLNYTKILRINKTIVTIPNSNIVDALIHNSSVFVKHTQKKTDEIELDLKEESKSNDSIVKLPDKLSIKFSPNKMMKPFLDTFDKKRITRFTFNVEIRQDFPNQKNTIQFIEERLNTLCKEFIPVFGFEPEFYFQDNYWRVTTTFIITSINARLVFENYSPFLEGILKSVYNINTGGNS